MKLSECPKGSWVQCDSGPSVMTDMEKRCLLPEQSPSSCASPDPLRPQKGSLAGVSV